MPAETLDDVFVAIAHPVRRSLIDTLAGGERPVSELARSYRVSRPAISQHLRVLVDAGLIEARRDGRNNRYSLRPGGLSGAYDWTRRYQAFWDERAARLGRYLDKAASRTPEE